jgi:hypothetical protein
MTWLRKHQQAVHGWLAVAWGISLVPTIVFKWYTSLVYVSALSLYAILATHWAGWSAERN